ncbi:MAG: chemotaxis protein CheW [Desulfobacter sp.]
MSCHCTTIDDTIKEIIINTGKYLTFSLGTEDYGIGIRNVEEIIGMIPVTAVPGTPGAVKGVVKLRGKVIPVINLRETFDMPPIPSSGHKTHPWHGKDRRGPCENDSGY